MLKVNLEIRKIVSYVIKVKLMRCSTSGADETSPKENSLRCGQTVTVHVANIRQTCLITQIDGSRLGRIGRDTTQTVTIRLKFIQHPVLLHANRSVFNLMAKS